LAWSPPEILGPPSLRSEVPVIALDRQGNGLVLWRSETILAAHYDKAKGWQPPEDLGSGSGYGPGAWLDLRGSGFGAWVAPDSSGLVQRFDPARGWGALTRFSPPDEHTFTRMGRLAFDGRGRAILLWHLVRGGRFLAPLWSASFDGETWSARGLISRPGQQVDVVHGSGAAVGMTTAGQGLAAWVEYGDGQDRLSSATFGFEQGWSTPEALAVAPFIGDVRVAINERGDGMLVYVAAEIESSLVTKYRLLAQRRLSGRWGPAELLRNGATKASLAVDPSGNAVVVWSEPAAEGIRVFANRFEVDAR
jgi:hypothetical protein